MIDRRMALALALSGLADAQGTGQIKKVFEQPLPDLSLSGWQVNAVEVSYGPGEESHVHKHAGFVVGYVLEGEIRFQLRGQPERTYKAGDMFYEEPGSVHQVSANASKSKPARLLALVFAEKGATLTTPA